MKKINNKKEWWKSRTIWVAIVTAVVSIITAFGVNIPTEIIGALIALGLYTSRTSTTNIGK